MLTRNDGLLACSLCRAEGISYDCAVERINQAAEAMNRLLHQTGSLPLGRIGTLTYDDSTDTVHFTPCESGAVSPATCWLPAISKAHEEKDACADEDSDANAAAITHYPPIVRFSKIAACMLALMGVCFVASTPISIHDAALASLSPEIKHVPAEEFLPAEEQPIPSISITASHKPNAAIDIDALPARAFASVASLKDAGRSHIVVVGSFATSAEALKFISERNNSALRFVEKDGRFRVFASAFASEIDAYRDINAHGYADTGAWVCPL